MNILIGRTLPINALLFFFLLAGLSSSCGDKVYDGEYCAEVDYYNPRTGTRSDYTLVVTADKGDLAEVKFTDGSIDRNDFGQVSLSSSGHASLKTQRGYQYQIQITGPSEGCLEDVKRTTQCKGYTAAGSRCSRKTDNPSGYCWQHE